MVVREATVGPLLGTRAVSGKGQLTRERSRPSPSAASWLKTVNAPWPISVELTRTMPPGRPGASQSRSIAARALMRASPSPVKAAPCAKKETPMPYQLFAPGFPRLHCFHCSPNRQRSSDFSSTAGEPTLHFSTWPVGVVSPWTRQFFNRNSCGVMPAAAARASMWLSSPQMACGAPKPRNAPEGTVFVRATRPLTKTWSQR